MSHVSTGAVWRRSQIECGTPLPSGRDGQQDDMHARALAQHRLHGCQRPGSHYCACLCGIVRILYATGSCSGLACNS